MKVPPRPRKGFSLVLVLVLLAGLSLAAASTARLSAVAQKLASGQRMQALALQSAEAALRYCENQLLLPDASRQLGLQEAALPASTPKAPAWQDAARWRPALVQVPAASLWPLEPVGPPAPCCLVERQSLASGTVHVVTARGFAPDWRGDAASGLTSSGSTAWLQSVLLIDGAVLAERVHRHLLQAPVR